MSDAEMLHEVYEQNKEILILLRGTLNEPGVIQMVRQHDVDLNGRKDPPKRGLIERTEKVEGRILWFTGAGVGAGLIITAIKDWFIRNTK